VFDCLQLDEGKETGVETGSGSGAGGGAASWPVSSGSLSESSWTPELSWLSESSSVSSKLSVSSNLPTPELAALKVPGDTTPAPIRIRVAISSMAEANRTRASRHSTIVASCSLLRLLKCPIVFFIEASTLCVVGKGGPGLAAFIRTLRALQEN
jgi:hypothetical protein